MPFSKLHPPLTQGPHAATLRAAATSAPDLTTQTASQWQARLSLRSHNGPLRYWYGAQRVDAAVQALLDRIAVHSGAVDYWRAMAAGEAVNAVVGQTGASAARHTALRDPAHPFFATQATRAITCALAQRTRQHLIWIGTGGSLTGPQALATALATGDRTVDYLSGLDSEAIAQVAGRASASGSLVVVASKSGSTREIAQNVEHLRGALQARGIQLPWIALTLADTVLDTESYTTRLYFDASIGGRFSTLSVIGVFLAAWLGGEVAARQLLAGARAFDLQTGHGGDWATNPALASALCGLWNRCALGLPGRAVIAYSPRLSGFPAFIQQLEMESLGKSCRRDGSTLPATESAPFVLTGEGPQSQHSFFQSLHQNALACETEILALHADAHGDALARERLHNALAQTLALSQGQPAEHPNRRFSGNRPTGLVLLDTLSPHALGALVAHYEHRTILLGALLGLNPFDQEGVTLGKALADSLRMQLSDTPTRLQQLLHTVSQDS